MDPGTSATGSVVAGGLQATVPGRVDTARARIAAASGGRQVRIVAVTKGFGPEAVRAAVDAGLDDLGENYAQELLAKRDATPPGVRWHFLGAVQTNKVVRLAPHVSVWEAVDRERAGGVIARRAPGAAVFVEVDVTGTPGRAGCRADAAPALVEALRGQALDVRGVMVVGPPGPPAAIQDAFGRAAELNRELGLAELSMGMSDDYEEAVRAGATTVRLGRALFGPRPSTKPARR